MRSSASFWLSLILSRISQRSPQDELCGFLCCLVTPARGIQTKEVWNLLAKALNSFRARFSSGDRRGDRGPRSTRNTARPTEISYISAGFTPRRDQARSEMLSLQLVPGRLLGRFSVCIHSRACPAELSWGMAPNQRSWDVLLQMIGGLTFRTLRISHLRKFFIVWPWWPLGGFERPQLFYLDTEMVVKQSFSVFWWWW